MEVVSSGKLYAYWIPLWKSYFYYAQKYPVSKDTGDRHLCNSGRVLGLTYDYSPEGPETRFPQSNKKRLTVTFCPSAFQTTKAFSSHSIHQTNGPVTPLAKIQDRQPTVLTFLHEAVHAVMGSETTRMKLKWEAHRKWRVCIMQYSSVLEII